MKPAIRTNQQKQIESLIASSLSHFKRGNLKGAKVLLSNVLKIDESNVYALRLLSRIAYREGDTESSYEFCDKALFYNPKDEKTWTLKGNLYFWECLSYKYDSNGFEEYKNKSEACYENALKCVKDFNEAEFNDYIVRSYPDNYIFKDFEFESEKKYPLSRILINTLVAFREAKYMMGDALIRIRAANLLLNELYINFEFRQTNIFRQCIGLLREISRNEYDKDYITPVFINHYFKKSTHETDPKKQEVPILYYLLKKMKGFLDLSYKVIDSKWEEDGSEVKKISFVEWRERKTEECCLQLKYKDPIYSKIQVIGYTTESCSVKDFYQDWLIDFLRDQLSLYKLFQLNNSSFAS